MRVRRDVAGASLRRIARLILLGETVDGNTETKPAQKRSGSVVFTK